MIIYYTFELFLCLRYITCFILTLDCELFYSFYQPYQNLTSSIGFMALRNCTQHLFMQFQHSDSISNWNNMQKFKLILFVILFAFKGIFCFGQQPSVASGAWTDPTVWSTYPSLPNPGPLITISAGNTINGTPGSTQYQLNVKGTLIFNGNYTNGSGGLTIENGGIMIIKGDLAFNSAIIINGNGKLYVTGNITQTGGSLTINNTGILVVGKNYTENWQAASVNNSGTILINGDYAVKGNLTQAGTAEIAVLGTAGAGCTGCVNSIDPADPAAVFYNTGNPNLWMGSVNSIWSNISNWTANKLPAPGTSIEFAAAGNNGISATNDLVLDSDRVVGSVKNLSTKRLYIPAGKCLTVNNSITTNNANQLYIQSSASGPGGSLIFHNAQNAPVSATVEMYSLASWNLTNPVGGKYKWQFFGLPLRSLASASPTFDGAYVREMRENDSPSHWYQLNNGSALSSFKGYEITQSAPTTYVFQGQLENNDYNITQPFTSGVSYPGQCLIGNSYAAAIDIKKIVFGTQMLATVYLYNTGTQNDWIANGQAPVDSTTALAGQYTAVPFAQAGIGTVPGQIPSMQAFLVRAKSNSASATVSIPYSAATTVVKNTTRQRVHASVSSGDTIKTSTDTLHVWTQVDVKGFRYSDRVWLFTDTACTHSFDNGWDGEKFLGSYVAPQLFAMEQDGDYQVNSVDDMNNSYLGFMPGVDSVYTLTFTHHNTNVRYSGIYLVDSVSNVTTDITAGGSTYTFETLPTDTIVKRFKIVTTVDIATPVIQAYTSTDPLKVFSSQRTIFVDNASVETGTLEVYDFAGQLVHHYPFSARQVNMIRTNLPPGIYVAKAITRKDKISRQLIIH